MATIHDLASYAAQFNREAAACSVAREPRTLGLLIPERKSWFSVTLIAYLDAFARRMGCALFVCTSNGDEASEADALEFLLAHDVDGIFCLPVTKKPAVFERLLERQIPLILLERVINPLRRQVDTILMDNTESSRQTISMLASMGHRRIGMLSGPEALFSTQQRLLGMRHALEENGLQLHEGLFSCDENTIQGGYRSLRRALVYKPTALIASSYESTVGALLALNEMHIKLPGALSFIGYDCHELARTAHPELTCLSQPIKGFCELAMRQMEKRLSQRDGETIGGRVWTLPVTLHEGLSVVPARLPQPDKRNLTVLPLKY